MALEARLAAELMRAHPGGAADVLERIAAEEGSRALARGPMERAARVVEHLSPQRAGELLARLSAERVGGVLEELPIGCASRVLRRLAPEQREAALGVLSERRARGLRSLVQFPEDSAGALMDPDVLALPETFVVEEALDRIRETPERARYNVYVVDAAQKLVGVVNLRELFLGKPGAVLSKLMVRAPQALLAHADRATIVSHPGWREVHSLPVVDAEGGYLGAIRYRTLRELEDQLLRRGARDTDARQALGQLFAAGAQGLVDAVASPDSGSEH